MRTILLGETGILVTPVGMSTRTIGPTRRGLSLEAGARVIRNALECGVNFLGVAGEYKTYPAVRLALDDLAPSFSQGVLSRPVIACKSPARDYGGMRQAIEECRAALNLDQVDVFLLDEAGSMPNGGTEFVPIDSTGFAPADSAGPAPGFEDRGGVWACLQDAKAKGHIRAAGLSTCNIDIAIGAPGMDALFARINYRGLGIRVGQESDLPVCKNRTDEPYPCSVRPAQYPPEAERARDARAVGLAAGAGIGVVATGALDGGKLAHDYRKALDYAAGLPGINSVMLGIGGKKDLDDAVAYFEGRLPEGFAPDAARRRMFIDRRDCAGCGACVDYCTSKAIRFDEEGIAVVNTEKCVLCGFCVQVCPTRALQML